MCNDEMHNFVPQYKYFIKKVDYGLNQLIGSIGNKNIFDKHDQLDFNIQEHHTEWELDE